MQNNAILLQELSIEELQELISNSLKSEIKHLQKEIQSKDNSEELLTREQACQFLKINSSTLWAWTCAGKIKAIGLGSRRYYRRSELLESLILLRK